MPQKRKKDSSGYALSALCMTTRCAVAERKSIESRACKMSLAERHPEMFLRLTPLHLKEIELVSALTEAT